MNRRWCTLALLAIALATFGSCAQKPVSSDPAGPTPGDASLAQGATRPEEACNAGDAKACFNLGLLFAEGRGMSKDEARAAALFTKACDGGNAWGCFNLGF